MCGIFGIASTNERPDAAVLRAMDRALAHRGPNDSGLYLDERAALGHRRLSIIDLDGGHQPIGNEDGQVQVILNGEIYNYRELRRDLEARGHRFRTQSDTEVLAHLYEERGADLCPHLRGMFAFAIWDKRRRTLLLARDRLGIKPLHYAIVGERLIFASELKALLADPALPRALDPAALDYYLAYSTTPSDRSLLQGVHKLEPAHLLLWRNGHAWKQRYWTLNFEPVERALDEETALLRERLEEVVDAHMIADVEVGAFLSGGLDSSAVTALARKRSGKLRTFSIGFRNERFNELPWARRVATHLDVDHEDQVVEPDILADLPSILYHLDEPMADESAIPTYYVSQLASRKVRVVLSGDGGDELFGGYDRYVVEARERRRYDHLPGVVKTLLRAVSAAMPAGARGKHFLRHAGLAFPSRFLDAAAMFPLHERESLLARELVPPGTTDGDLAAALSSSAPDALASLLRFDHVFSLPLDILCKVDRMSMAFGLEVRPPLLDHTLVEHAATIASARKIRPYTGERKWIFKRAVEDLLPAEILQRSKWGFGVPACDWTRGPLRSFIEEVLRDPVTRGRGLFVPAEIDRLLSSHASGHRDESHKLWGLLVLELWQRQFLDAPSILERKAAYA